MKTIAVPQHLPEGLLARERLDQSKPTQSIDNIKRQTTFTTPGCKEDLQATCENII